jgi:hypothetical protein
MTPTNHYYPGSRRGKVTAPPSCMDGRDSFAKTFNFSPRAINPRMQPTSRSSDANDSALPIG